MVNPLQTVEIPIAGRGFAPRPQGNYQPGEYRFLTNVEINRDGVLKNRRAVRAILTWITWDTWEPIADTWDTVSPAATWDNVAGVGNPEDKAAPVRNPGKFIGHLNEWAIFTTGIDGGNVFATNRTEQTQWFGSTWLINVANFPSVQNAYFAGFHRYNKMNHFVTMQLFGNVAGGVQQSAQCKVWRYDPPGSLGNSTDPFKGSLGGVPSFSGLAFTVNTDAASTAESFEGDMQIVTSFVMKDRLWIATRSTLYASKATDLTNFTAEFGFFVRLPDEKINDVLFVQDTIYIICDSSVWIFNYDANPGADGQLTKIADGIGGDSGCVHQDSVYFARNDSLYSVESNRVTKVLDLNYNVPAGSSDYTLKCISYMDYIIMAWQKWEFISVTGPPLAGSGSSENFVSKYRAYLTSVPGPEKLVPIIWLNMENGASHKFCFWDQQDAFAPADQMATYYGDFYLCPWEDRENRQSLYFQSSGNKVTDPGFTRGFTYYIDWDEEDFRKGGNYYDTVCRANGFTDVYTTHLNVEMDSYAPDGSEFFMKKFRTLMVEMECNNYPLMLKYSFGDWPDFWTQPLVMDNQVPNFKPQGIRPPYPYRFPINQRGRSITLSMTAEPFLMANKDYESSPTRLLIERIVLTWSPTIRAPVGQAVE